MATHEDLTEFEKFMRESANAPYPPPGEFKAPGGGWVEPYETLRQYLVGERSAGRMSNEEAKDIFEYARLIGEGDSIEEALEAYRRWSSL